MIQNQTKQDKQILNLSQRSLPSKDQEDKGQNLNFELTFKEFNWQRDKKNIKDLNIVKTKVIEDNISKSLELTDPKSKQNQQEPLDLISSQELENSNCMNQLSWLPLQNKLKKAKEKDHNSNNNCLNKFDCRNDSHTSYNSQKPQQEIKILDKLIKSKNSQYFVKIDIKQTLRQMIKFLYLQEVNAEAKNNISEHSIQFKIQNSSINLNTSCKLKNVIHKGKRNESVPKKEYRSVIMKKDDERS